MANFKYTDPNGIEWRALNLRTTSEGKTFGEFVLEGSDYTDVKNMWVETVDLIPDVDPGPTYDHSGNAEHEPVEEPVEE